MKVGYHTAFSDFSPAAWNALAGSDNPFLRHGVLLAFEAHGCVGPRLGWEPLHVGAYNDAGDLLGAMPMYVKYNYYGEFVFDWAWDEAYQRAGLNYYPKLVVAVPYTPATGARLLCRPDADRPTVERALIAAAMRLTENGQHSGVHWLFPNDGDLETLRDAGLIARMGVNFHWHNQDYADFDAFLASFSADKRKKVKRERRRVGEQGIQMRRAAGAAISDADLATFHRFYVDTFDKHHGLATLTLDFFSAARDELGDHMILVSAWHAGHMVAGALFFRDHATLFGRYWGCEREFHSLHFETCYYQGHEIAIEHGLTRFEPGVQGEHKVPRGFLPTRTWSAHWIADPRFRPALADYCRREQLVMEDYLRSVYAHSPYRHDSTPPSQRIDIV
ncbi:MAG: GNAT family N-acetyltransferase [Thiotrichales bacterium]